MGTIKLSDIGNSNAHYRFYTFETFLKHQKRNFLLCAIRLEAERSHMPKHMSI